MNFRRKIISAAFLASAALAAFASPASAAATLELYADHQTGYVNGSIRLSFFPFSGTGYTWNLQDTGGSAPEGVQRGLMTVNSSVGQSWGGWGIQFFDYGTSAVVTQDMSAYANGQLRFLVNCTEDLGVEIQWGTTGTSTVLIPNTGGQWKEDVIDLNQFTGITYSQIKVPFIIKRLGAPSTATTFLIDHVRWTKPVASMQIISTSTWLTNGRHRQYTMLAKDANGEETIIYSTWTVTGTGNSVSPGIYSRYTILTVGSGSGTLTARTTTDNAPNYSTSTTMSVTPGAAQDSQLGLLADSVPGLTFGLDSDLGAYSGGGATIAGPTAQTTDYREGYQSFVTTVTVPAGGYAGWFIQAGISGTPDTTTVNMANYYDGAIRFWFKAPAGLDGKLKLGIRSGNVPSNELSSVMLTSTYYTFNNTWQSVVIPVSQFAKAAPWADLSRMKILFNISTDQNTGGSQVFYVDKLRWDTQIPGSLNKIVVTPGVVTIPLNLKKTFTAAGYDSSGVNVDIWPTWSVSSVGTLANTFGTSNVLTAGSSSATGGVSATQVVVGSATVTISTVAFTQCFNVYSDAGAGGQIGTDSSGLPSVISLSNPEYQPGNAPEGLKVMHATFTVSGTNAYATWFVYEVTGSRYMANYNAGYLHFWVRSTRDLEVSIRSNNVASGSNNAKIRLSSLGVPLDGNWQEVWLSLNDLKTLEPNLDFSQMKVYFGIAAIQSEIGDQSNQVFDVDDARWCTDDQHVPDPNKVYIGLKNKQSATTGLVVTYDNDSTNRAVTYDQALAAMAYTYKTDTALSKKVLDVFKAKYDAGGYAGFNNEYDRDTPSIIRDYDRTAGPNAWIMMAAIHYRVATSSTVYDTMINGIGTWLKSLQDTDGAIKYGFQGVSGTAATFKSTEQNFDVYTAFKAWYTVSGNASYNTAANSVYAWLISADTNTVVGAWNTPQGRFNVGKLTSGARNNDYALDAYSWAPLALNGYVGVLDQAENLFTSTHTADVNGLAVNGFDFSGTPGNGTTIAYGLVPDKDAVWLEGTAQMAVAYLAAGRQSKANQYLNELDKAVFTIANGGQGLTYATNAGTAYWTGSLMDSTHAAISPMAWYLFAKWGFNPMQPLPLFEVAVRNISDSSVVSTVTWSAAVPTRWVRASQYIQIRTQGADYRPWGLQIYTDNTNSALPVRYVDPTPTALHNPDSDPAGLLEMISGTTTVHYKLPLAWRVLNSTATLPVLARPYDVNLGAESPESYSWYYFKDKNTPAIDNNNNGTTTDPGDGTPFTPGETYVTVKTNSGIQTSGNSFNQSFSPDFIFLEADFGTASAQIKYSANIVLEFFVQ